MPTGYSAILIGASVLTLGVTSPNPPEPPAEGSIVPGAGWAGDILQPDAVGDPEAAGYTATAIARWDDIPRRDMANGDRIGLVAFHLSGIDRVEFYCNGGTGLSVATMVANADTAVVEFSAPVDLTGVADGTLLKFRAIVYPNVGIPFILQGDDPPLSGGSDETVQSMILWANTGGTMQSGVMYVNSTATIPGTPTGTFTQWERITQATSGASAFYISGTTTMNVGYVGGTPDDSNTWTGARSAATFAPSATPTFAGDDSNDGSTALLAKRTIPAAVTALNTANGSTSAGCEGCTIYCRGVFIRATVAQGTAKRWVTYAPFPGDTAADCVFTNFTANVAAAIAHKYSEFSGVTLFQQATGTASGGYAVIRYNSTGYQNRFWIHNCVSKGIGNMGTEAEVSQQEIVRSSDAETTMKCFWTGGTLDDHCSLAFPGGSTLIRGVTISNMGADICNYPALFVSNTLDTLNHTDTDIHPDLYQCVGAINNLIVYNNRYVNQTAGQGFTLGNSATTTQRVAIVQNVVHSSNVTQPTYMPFGSSADHILIWNNYISHEFKQGSGAGAVTNSSIAGNVFRDTNANLSALGAEMVSNHSITGTYTAAGTDWTTGDPGFVNAGELNFIPDVGSVLLARVARKTLKDLAEHARSAMTAACPYAADAET